jgi:hypothetical protein
MDGAKGWARIEAEAHRAFGKHASFPIRAYSESMPPPYVGLKPYAPRLSDAPCTAFAEQGDSLEITEYEQAQEIEPGLDHIAQHLVAELGKLVRGEGHALSHTLLDDNPAWPRDLADAAHRGLFAKAPLALLVPLALSRTQDDKGNVRWTLFGASHEGPAAPFWRSLRGDAATARDTFARLVAWAAGVALGDLVILADPSEVPAALHDRLSSGALPADARAVFTLRPFASLPAEIREATLEGRITLVPSPASLVFFEHRRYARLARELAHATQIPLLHLFPRVQGGYALRIPQSGWIEERDPAQHAHGHRIVSHVARSHRWERILRDEPLGGDGQLTDKVSVALFSAKPDDIGLYGKPMARNAQLWFETYELLLDGQTATPAEMARAAEILDAGGRFGYRFFYPPMRAGARALYWHVPLVARLSPDGRAERLHDRALLGHVTAERVAERHADVLVLEPRFLERSGHDEAARLFAHETVRPGAPRSSAHARLTTSHNARKILEMRALLDRPLAPSFARALLRVAKGVSLETWIAELPERAGDPVRAARLVEELGRALGTPVDAGPAFTFEHTRTRAFEEQVWRTIASLAEGDFRAQENADPVRVNEGRSGGPAARAAAILLDGGRPPKPPAAGAGSGCAANLSAERRDLERLGDHLHERYRELVIRHGMQGRAVVCDHVFRWETDFDFAWSEGWSKNQTGEARERNIVLVIPGKNRREAVVMGDHYDTAYMEDVYEPERGGDRFRAAASGADDNHSATTALLLAADVLLPLAREGKLERDVWLVHLTGEEFPADCLGARALAEALVEHRLAFTGEDGDVFDVSGTRVVGAFILDMIGHNTERDRDIFQIAPGEGAASARLALFAHAANERWNAAAQAWNRADDRRHKGRALRMPDGAEPPPPFSHLPLAGEIRTEWEPKSSLYNTDGQIFSDVGVPVVLFMENYDIRRTGYHDTHDTMKNIDLDYCAALTAIAIETVTSVACAAM